MTAGSSEGERERRSERRGDRGLAAEGGGGGGGCWKGEREGGGGGTRRGIEIASLSAMGAREGELARSA